MHQSDLRLLIPALSMWGVGIAWRFGGWPVTLIVLVILVVAALVRGLFKNIGAKVQTILGQLIMAAVVSILLISSASIYDLAKDRSVMEEYQTEQTPVTLVGQVTGSPNVGQSFGTVCRFQMQTKALGVDQIWTNQSWRVQVTVPQTCAWEYGDEIEVRGILKPPFNRANDSDFEASVGALPSAESSDGSSWRVIQPAQGIDYVTNSIRAQFNSVLQTIPFSSQGLVLAMVLGDERLLDSDVKEEALTSGLTHLLVVSGGHFIMLLSLICSFLKRLRVHKYVLWFSSIIVGLALIFLVHPQDSLMRAAIMCLIGVSSVWVKRRSQSVAALSVTVIVGLIINPAWLFSISFALSASATAGIILLAPVIRARLSRGLGELPAELVAISLSASIASMPVILLINDFLPIWTVLANVLASPLVAVITISGFLAVLLCYVPVLNWAIACLAGFFGQGVELVLDFIQYIPGARIQWPTGPLGSLAFILTIITIWLALRGLRHWGSRRNYFEKPDRPSVFAGVVENFRSVISAHKYLKNALFVVILVPALGVSWWNHNALGSHLDSDWLVAGCPVGQGDSFVVNLGDSHGILIDAGPDPILVDQCLTTLKIETIDLLILSHFHDDHVGGLSGAIKTREVGTIWVSNSNDEVAQSQSVFSLLASQSLSATRVQSGFSFGTDGVNFAGFKTSSNIAAVNFAGFEFSSTESSGTESAGTESTTSESFGTESAAPKSAGTEFVSTETASTESAAPKYAGNGSATSDSAGTKSAAPESSGTESVSVELAAPAPAAPQLADFKTSPNLGSAGSDLKVLVVSALPGEDLEGNEASVVVYLELRGLSMLFLGDSEVMAQAAALENLKTLGIDQIDLVKVAHHGSKTQDAELYKYLGARVALIGVGENNYGHPHPETVAMLKNLGITVVNTLDQGLCGIIKTADNEQIFALGGG